MNYISQKQTVLRHLRRRPLSTWVAISRYKITRLARCIHELRRDGYEIVARTVQRGSKRWALYRLTH
jgi:hypothetical protein